MASEKQVNYIKSLAQDRDLSGLTPEQNAALITDGYLETLNNNQVNEILSLLKQLPYPPKDPAPVGTSNKEGGGSTEVMAARYFIVDPTDNVEKFIHVQKPEPPSKWVGYTFVSVRASDDLYPIKDKTHREAILAEIAKDPVTAMNLYGIKLGVCGMCGRTLTQRDSRLRGLGPICAGKVQASPEDIDLLSQLGLI
jgi:Family of unknown function (DUF6011)